MEVYLVISEDHNLVLSGGKNQKAILHDMTLGKVLKVFYMDYGDLRSICKFESLVAFVDVHNFCFIDLRTKTRIKNYKVNGPTEYICCSNSNFKTFEKNRKIDLFLFAGYVRFNKIFQIRIPENLKKLSKQFTKKIINSIRW